MVSYKVIDCIPSFSLNRVTVPAPYLLLYLTIIQEVESFRKQLFLAKRIGDPCIVYLMQPSNKFQNSLTKLHLLVLVDSNLGLTNMVI